MNFELIDKIAKAVLYEGYLLYPYRLSAEKNRHRWNFGALYPPSYSVLRNGNDTSSMQTECLLMGNRETTIQIYLRFLQLISRRLQDQTRQEAAERTVPVIEANLGDLAVAGSKTPFSFGAATTIDEQRIECRQESISGYITVTATRLSKEICKLTVKIHNDTPWDPVNEPDREDALLRSFVSTHAILATHNGEFISLLETPDAYREYTKHCTNTGNWPVLVGEPNSHDAMLASPIILYDYPQIAPESAGDLFDSTEIDEILTLRILTLTDEEKNEIRNSDERGRKLLERTETLPQEHLMKLHGVLRSMKKVTEETSEVAPWDPWESKPAVESVKAFGVEVKKGDRVRLWPVKGADILDMALTGRTAIIEAIEEDYDGVVHLAVIVEDDPGKDLGELRQPGHRFFFTPEEVEPI